MKKCILVFASLCCLSGAAAMAAEAPGSTPASTPQSRVGSTYTVEELYKNGAELHNKKVVVHGEAVKVTPNIMGKIWTHIQDGTGDESKGTNDIICISATDKPGVGDMVTITGTVVFNPEGRYKLVIEDATIKK